MRYPTHQLLKSAWKLFIYNFIPRTKSKFGLYVLVVSSFCPTDPLEMKFELLRRPLHFHQDPSQAPEWLRKADSEIKAADGFLIVTPEYNSTLPPALSNMLDHFSPQSYAYRPVAFASYSPGNQHSSKIGTIKPLIQDFVGSNLLQYPHVLYISNSCETLLYNRQLGVVTYELICFVKAAHH